MAESLRNSSAIQPFSAFSDRSWFSLDAALSSLSDRLAHDVLERFQEPVRFLSGADRDAEVLVHRREWTADQHALLLELVDDGPHGALEVDHEEIGLGGNHGAPHARGAP